MAATLIDGKALAAKVKSQVAEEAGKLSRKPGLAVVLVGEDPASQVYVAGKERDCAECGIESFGYRLPADTGEKDLLDLIRQLNGDGRVDGILVQLPLPGHLHAETVIHAIAPDKDVDCFHPFNVGRLVTGDPVFLPCTRRGLWRCWTSTRSPSGESGAWYWAGATLWASPWPRSSPSGTVP